MKKLLLILVLAGTVACSNKKEDDFDAVAANEHLIGTWLQITETDHKQLLTFNSDFTRIRSFIQTTTNSILPGEPLPYRLGPNIITDCRFDFNLNDLFYQITGDTLILHASITPDSPIMMKMEKIE